MRNDYGADGNGTLDGFCPGQHVRDGQRAVYDLQSVAGRCACGVDRRERRRNLLTLCALLGIDRTAFEGVLRSVRRWLLPRVIEALGYIPPAAFAALVANDLISPGAFGAGLWQGLISWIAAADVMAVAIKTKSMLWCFVSGIVLYIVLSLI